MENNEFTEKTDRLQMAMYAVLYRHSAGFTNIPNLSLDVLLSKTDWAHEPDHARIRRVFTDYYTKELNVSLDALSPNPGRLQVWKGGPPKWQVDKLAQNCELTRFPQFVVRVMQELHYHPNPRFEYLVATK